jgi:cytochrome c biogenesis protein CcmG/thiol:disulfide interchange protein DsbE
MMLPMTFTLLLSAGWPCPAEPAARPAASAAPTAIIEAAFSDLKGTPRSLSEFRGKVVLLEFWAPWCIPCRKGFPWLDQLQKRHAGAGLVVVAVTLEQDDASVRAFLDDHQAGFLIGRDPSGRSADSFGVTVMPTSILLGRNGAEIARFEGGAESLHPAIEAAVVTAIAGTSQPAGGPPAALPPGARGHMRAWERGYLADPIMNLDGDRLTRSMREHIHASKEAAAGDGGVAGGGCGCN